MFYREKPKFFIQSALFALEQVKALTWKKISVLDNILEFWTGKNRLVVKNSDQKNISIKRSSAQFDAMATSYQCLPPKIKISISSESLFEASFCQN